MLNPNFAILASLISLVSVGGYISETLRGRAQPNRVTWSLWALISLLAFAGELDRGVGVQALMTLALGIGPICVLIVSLRVGGAYWRLGRFDLICAASALAGLALWLVTGNGLLAVVCATIADLLAALPTIVKAWRAPESESYWPFAVGVLAASLTLLTVSHWSIAECAFPAVVLFNSLTLALFVKFEPGPRLRRA